MSEWREVRLGEILQVKYGKDHKKLEEGNIPVYGSGGIMRYGDKYLYDQPSVLIPRKGTLSNIFLVEKPFWTVDTMFWTIIDSSKILPKYLYYAIKDYRWDSLNVGSAVPSLIVPVIEGVSINLPSLATQHRIASILSSLDDKIECNRKICANLESQAQALFKHWFIDFAPFKDGKFIDSELGMIPEGWRVGRIKEIGSTNKRSASKFCNVIEYLDTGSITKNVIEGTLLLDPNNDKIPSRAKRLVCEGDIIFSTVRPNQNHYGFMLNPKRNLVVSTGFTVLTANWSGYRYYLYLFLTQEKIINTLQAIAEQSVSTYPSINASDIENLSLVIPPIKVLEKVVDTFACCYLNIAELQQENKNLATLRDTLLPKLMSGQIKV